MKYLEYDKHHHMIPPLLSNMFVINIITISKFNFFLQEHSCKLHCVRKIWCKVDQVQQIKERMGSYYNYDKVFKNQEAMEYLTINIIYLDCVC